MALRDLNRHQQRLLRDEIRREHSNRSRPTREQREARRERLEFKKRKENERERERTAD